MLGLNSTCRSWIEPMLIQFPHTDALTLSKEGKSEKQKQLPLPKPSNKEAPCNLGMPSGKPKRKNDITHQLYSLRW